MADARHLPHGRSRAGDRHLNFYETRDNLRDRVLGQLSQATEEGLGYHEWQEGLAIKETRAARG